MNNLAKIACLFFIIALLSGCSQPNYMIISGNGLWINESGTTASDQPIRVQNLNVTENSTHVIISSEKIICIGNCS